MKQEKQKQIRLYLVKQLLKLTIWLKNKDKEPDSSVISLAPKVLSKEDDIKIIQPYLDELERSLNEKNITNIAITGAYGSGKSTIIKTFQDIHQEYEYLNISLASFTDNDENGKKKSNNVPNGEGETSIQGDYITNFERRLEISILQQIFYHVKPSEIPDSRFKRINNNKWWKLLLASAGLILWLISTLLLFKFNYINKINPSTWHTSLRVDWVAFSSIIFFLQPSDSLQSISYNYLAIQKSTN